MNQNWRSGLSLRSRGQALQQLVSPHESGCRIARRVGPPTEIESQRTGVYNDSPAGWRPPEQAGRASHRRDGYVARHRHRLLESRKPELRRPSNMASLARLA